MGERDRDRERETKGQRYREKIESKVKEGSIIRFEY